MSVYFKNRYRCTIAGNDVPLKSFYYRADMKPVLRWKKWGIEWTYGAPYWTWWGTDRVALGQFWTVYIFYYFAPQITEVLQISAADVPTFTRIWDKDMLDWSYSPPIDFNVKKSLSDITVFNIGGRNSGKCTSNNQFQIYPRDPETCRMISIRTDTGPRSYTSTWRASGSKEWYFVPRDDLKWFPSLSYWFSLRNSKPDWPTGGLIQDGSYVRNDATSWGIRCSPRTTVIPGQYIDFGAVSGRITSYTEWASGSQATVEIGGYHTYMDYIEGIGEPQTFYGMCKIICYETVRLWDQDNWEPWEIRTIWQKGPRIGDPAAFNIFD